MRDDGCFSALLWDGVPFAVSVERTFEDGRPILGNGVYRCARDFYHKGGYWTFEIAIKGHSEVKFHKGNTELDSLGCPLVAESFGAINGLTAVLDSKGGFSELMLLADGLDEFEFEVTGR